MAPPFVRQEPNRFALHVARFAAPTQDGAHWQWIGPVCRSQEEVDTMDAHMSAHYSAYKYCNTTVADADSPDDAPAVWANLAEHLTAEWGTMRAEQEG